MGGKYLGSLREPPSLKNSRTLEWELIELMREPQTQTRAGGFLSIGLTSLALC